MSAQFSHGSCGFTSHLTQQSFFVTISFSCLDFVSPKSTKMMVLLYLYMKYLPAEGRFRGHMKETENLLASQVSDPMLLEDLHPFHKGEHTSPSPHIKSLLQLILHHTLPHHVHHTLAHHVLTFVPITSLPTSLFPHILFCNHTLPTSHYQQERIYFKRQYNAGGACRAYDIIFARCPHKRVLCSQMSGQSKQFGLVLALCQRKGDASLPRLQRGQSQ